MSATPIPRSLGLVIYGDLEISVIRHKPAGRAPVETAYLNAERQLQALYHRLASYLQEGDHRAYMICPLKTQATSHMAELFSVESLNESLQKTALATIPRAVMHGNLKAEEKQEVMGSFARGEVKLLLATTVVEVGVDVPEASVIIIYDAEHFGLAQLHQLRGRVGRSQKRSTCWLYAPNAKGKSQERLEAFCKIHDGFELAEMDLQLRGLGDMWGTRQHGLPSFKVANLYVDASLVAQSQQLAEAVLTQTAPQDAQSLTHIDAAIRERFGVDWSTLCQG